MKKVLLLSLSLALMSSSLMPSEPAENQKSKLVKYYDVIYSAVITAAFGYGTYSLLMDTRQDEHYSRLATMMFAAGLGYFGFRTYQSALDVKDAVEEVHA